MHPANKLKNGILTSGLEGEDGKLAFKLEVPRGSFYREMVHIFNEHINEYGDWDWLYNYITGDKFKASEFEPYSKRFAVILSQHGFKRGDTLYVSVGNHNFVYPLLGGAWIHGGRVSCGDISMEKKDIAGQLIDLNAKIVVCIPSTSKNVIEAAEEVENNCSKKIEVFSFGDVTGCGNLLKLVEEVEESKAPNAAKFTEDEMKQDCLIVFWSSGTTGLPKGICHNHITSWNYVGWAVNATTEHGYTWNNTASTSAFSRVGGFFKCMVACRKRQCYWQMCGNGLTLKMILDAIAESKNKLFVIGTHQYVQLAESKYLEEYASNKLDYLELLVPSGAAVPASCEIAWKAKCRNLKAVLNVYGLTETGTLTMNDNNQSLGYVQPGVQLKIIEPNRTEVCGANERGEICVKTDFMMIGYLNREAANKKVFDVNGFFRTGDLGCYDDSGMVHYFDRMKEVIKYQNNHVSPTEIEDILQKHPAVYDCLIFGKECPKVQELITAVVVKKKNYEVTEEELIGHVNGQVIDFKNIRGGVYFRDTIPRTNVGKLVRKDMRDWARKTLEEGNTE